MKFLTLLLFLSTSLLGNEWKLDCINPETGKGIIVNMENHSYSRFGAYIRYTEAHEATMYSNKGKSTFKSCSINSSFKKDYSFNCSAYKGSSTQLIEIKIRTDKKITYALWTEEFPHFNREQKIACSQILE